MNIVSRKHFLLEEYDHADWKGLQEVSFQTVAQSGVNVDQAV